MYTISCQVYEGIRPNSYYVRTQHFTLKHSETLKKGYYVLQYKQNNTVVLILTYF